MKACARLFFALCFLIMPVVSRGGASAGESRTLIVRFDDYAPFPLHGHPPAQLELLKKLFDLFAKRKAVIVVAVVPFAEGGVAPRRPESTTADESWLADEQNPWTTLLREYVDRGVVEPSLHGFTHRRASEMHRPGEFEGKPLEWQLSALRTGRLTLERALHHPVRGFVPPWNAWDAATVRAMDDLGFEWLSPDLHHADAGQTQIRVIPQCASQPREVLQWIREDRIPPEAVIVLVTHPFDFDDLNTGEAYFRDLDELLSVVEMSSRWRAMGFSETISHAPWLGTKKNLSDAVKVEQRRALLVDSLGGQWLSRGAPMFLSGRDNARTAGSLLLRLILLAAVTVAASLAVVYWVAKASRAPQWVHSVGLSAASCAALVLLLGAWRIHLAGYHVRGIRWQCLLICMGAFGGVGLSRWKRSARRATQCSLGIERPIESGSAASPR